MILSALQYPKWPRLSDDAISISSFAANQVKSGSMKVAVISQVIFLPCYALITQNNVCLIIENAISL